MNAMIIAYTHQCFFFVYNRDGEEWHRVRQTIAPKIMRPKIVEENIGNFNAVSKDAVARFVKLKEACEQDDHIPDLEKELNRWSMEGELIRPVWGQWMPFAEIYYINTGWLKYLCPLQACQ